MRGDDTTSGEAFELIAFVTRHLACHSCGSAYRFDNVQVTQHHRQQWVLLATCPTCTAQRPIVAYNGPPYGHLETPDDLPILPPLTAQDVLEWRAFLRQFTGDMDDLLSTP